MGIASSINTSFNDDDKIAKCKWTIQKGHLQKFKHLKNGFMGYTCSDTFPSLNDLEWYLKCYPNGKNADTVGNCALFLCLSSLPDSYKKITMYYYLFCEQTHSSWEYISIFDANHMNRGWPNGVQSSLELIHSSSISFVCAIRILKIINHSNNICYQYPLNLYHIYQKQTIIWNIDSILMQKFKTANCAKEICGCLLTNQNKMFTIICAPNGISVNSEGYLSLYLQLCCLPMNVESIKVKYTLKCPQIKQQRTYICTFSYDDSYYGSSKYCVLSNLLLNTSLQFIAIIEIIECYDSNENILSISNIKSQSAADQDDNSNNNSMTSMVMGINSNIKNSYDDCNKITKCKWNINEKYIEKFKNLPNGSNGFTASSDFISSNNLKWYLKCYPNGDDSDSDGNCNLYLYLSLLPDMYKNITIYYYLYCEQTDSCEEGIAVFDEDLMGWGWANGTQLSSELINLSSISFICGIRILKIINHMNSDNNQNICYQYPLNLSDIYQKQKIIWNIDNILIKKFKTANCEKEICGRLLSNINNMFTITCYPNGHNQTYKGYLSLYLQLCSLPMNVDSIKIEYTLKCIQENEQRTTSSYTFSYDDSCDGSSKYCILSDLLKYNPSLEFVAIINIMECYDFKGNIMSSNGKLRLFKSLDDAHSFYKKQLLLFDDDTDNDSDDDNKNDIADLYHISIPIINDRNHLGRKNNNEKSSYWTTKKSQKRRKYGKYSW